MFAPESTNAQIIYNLTIIIFAIAAIVFVGVEGTLLYFMFRYRRKGAVTGLPNQIEGNTKIEIAWTVLPAIVLAIVFFFSTKALFQLSYLPNSQNTSAGADPIHVRVIGHQWWWEFDYPDLKIVTSDVMHVPVNTVINIDVESVDVIHSYWVPQLNGKMDAIPGHDNKTWFEASTPGIYHGQCAEYCGNQHAGMRMEIIAESPEQFQAWVKQQQSTPAAPSGLAAQGQQTFLNGACIGCHTIDGTKAQGKVGPNLTHFGSREYFSGAILTNTPENVAKWLQDPQALKPGNLMPNLHLSQDQINALVAYLESLK